MLKEYFLEKVTNTVKVLVEENKLGQMSSSDVFSLQGETPKNAQFGDFAVNVSSLARFVKLAPPQIAQIIADNIEKDGFDINIAECFINFKLHILSFFLLFINLLLLYMFKMFIT